MPADRLPPWVSSWASLAAPATSISALLFYFGYVSARAQYQYFGIDVDTAGLGTKDYIMRSPQPLLVPALALTLAGTVTVLAHGRISTRVGTATASHDRRTLLRIHRLNRIATATGLLALGTGVLLIVAYPALRDWAPYDLVTPLVTAAGAATVRYTSHIANLIHRPRRSKRSVPTVRVLLYAIIAVNALWATATAAQWSGRGLAQDVTQHLDTLPRVILDTKEPLFLRSPHVEETTLPGPATQTYHYRYRGLRLLIVGHDRMFLVPESWSPSDSTLVIPIDDSVRIQFQFENAGRSTDAAPG